MDSPPTTRTGSPVLSVIFFLLGASALALTVTGNAWFGMSLADDPTTQYWQGGTAVYIDIMVAALAGACGFLVSRRRFASGIFVGLLALIFAVASTASLIGLGATERIAKAKSIEMANAAAKEATADKNVFAAGAHERNLSWLRKEASNLNLGRAERRELRQELMTALKEGAPVIAPRTTAPMADPQAEFLSAQTGIPVDRLQMIAIASLAILLIVGKGVCFWLSGYLASGPKVSERPLSIANEEHSLPLSNVPIENKSIENERGALTLVDNSGDVEQFEDEENTPQQSSTLSLPNPPQISDEERDSEVRRLGTMIREDVNRHTFDRTILAQFLAERTRTKAGGRVSAADLYGAYIIYARKNNYSVLSQNLFGRLCTEAGLQRISNRRVMDYLDLTLIPEAGVREAPHAAAA
jgi:hypothetical protein